MFMRMVYDDKLAQAAYLIGCQRTGEAIVIDPERDVDRYIKLAEENGLRIVAAAETHIHADFVSGSRELAERVGARVYLSDEGDADWKYAWLDKKLGGGRYDAHLLKNGDTFRVGNIEFQAVHTPGHTPEHMMYVVTDRGGGADEPIGVATGDFVFVGDLGRPDLLEKAAGQAGAMEPAARRLFASIETLRRLPDFVQVWPGHGAGSACGKALGGVPTSTIGYERRFSPALRAATDEQGFVDFILTGQPEPPLYFANMKRDNKLGPPVLGGLPTPERVTVETVSRLDPQEVAIVDTRPRAAFRAGRLEGSISVPQGLSFNTNAGSVLRDTDEIYLVVDEHRLEESVRDLIRVGLDRIRGWLTPADLEAYAAGGGHLASGGTIGVEEAAEMVRSDRVDVLDVRRATEFAEGHLPGAKNIAHTRLASRLEEVPRDRPILVYCRSGERSGVAASLLRRAGFDAVNLAGGIEAWESGAAPMEREGVRQTAG
ncbi:MAG: rhodanese-like domain-containing protein [Phycisphaerales bacterium JB059]